MKWLPFLLLIILSCFCRNSSNNKKHPSSTVTNRVSEKIIYDLPWETSEDSGYFKGLESEKLDDIDWSGSSNLSLFLSGLISKKEIVLLDSQTLSHSAFIDQKTKTRFDTLRNNNTILTSEYKFSKYESQIIKLNNIVIKNYTWDGNDTTWEYVLDFDGSSFRHFSFKENEFWYIQARVIDGHYGSIHTITYHLILSSKAKSPAIFETCRFDPMLFGDANGDTNLDFLDFNNSDFCTGVPSSDNATIQLYSCEEKGNFVLQKDKKAKPYFIDGKTGFGFTQDSFNMVNSYWFRPIK